MTSSPLLQLVARDLSAGAHFALIDSAATAAVTDDDDIYNQLREPEIEKYPLLTGENAWAMERAAPYLVSLKNQAKLRQWLLKNGWGRGWAVFFTCNTDPKTVLTHLRRFFAVRAENGRELFFRFYDPVILREFLPMLSVPEALFFFGPIQRFVLEDENSQPLIFDRPAGEPAAELDPDRLVTSKRRLFAQGWNRRLMPFKRHHQPPGPAHHL